MNAPPRPYRSRVHRDPESGCFMVPVPPDALHALALREGDMVDIETDQDGSFKVTGRGLLSWLREPISRPRWWVLAMASALLYSLVT